MSSSANTFEAQESHRRATFPGASVAAPVCAALLGLVLLYAAGFAQTEAIHNGAHDARHASGFACH
jgi:cobalt transporter subunit CbtB